MRLHWCIFPSLSNLDLIGGVREHKMAKINFMEDLKLLRINYLYIR